MSVLKIALVRVQIRTVDNHKGLLTSSFFFRVCMNNVGPHTAVVMDSECLGDNYTLRQSCAALELNYRSTIFWNLQTNGSRLWLWLSHSQQFSQSEGNISKHALRNLFSLMLKSFIVLERSWVIVRKYASWISWIWPSHPKHLNSN